MSDEVEVAPVSELTPGRSFCGSSRGQGATWNWNGSLIGRRS
jgi:hypothetical protein